LTVVVLSKLPDSQKLGRLDQNALKCVWARFTNQPADSRNNCSDTSPLWDTRLQSICRAGRGTFHIHSIDAVSRRYIRARAGCGR